MGTGEVAGSCRPSRDGAEFPAFVKRATAPYAGREIHVVLDNLSTSTTPEVKAWLERNAHVTFHSTPVGWSWPNQVETWFGLITKQAIRRGTFTSVSALIGEIRACIEDRNTRAEPFVWTATADEILAKVRLVRTNVKKPVDNNAKYYQQSSRRLAAAPCAAKIALPGVVRVESDDSWPSSPSNSLEPDRRLGLGPVAMSTPA